MLFRVGIRSGVSSRFVAVIVGRNRLTWVPGKPCIHAAWLWPKRFWSSGGRVQGSRLLRQGLVYGLTPEVPFLGECRRDPKHFWSPRACLRHCSASGSHIKKGLVPHFGMVGCQTNICQQIHQRLFTLVSEPYSLRNKISFISYERWPYLFHDTTVSYPGLPFWVGVLFFSRGCSRRIFSPTNKAGF